MATLLDGGMGHELKLRGVKQPKGWEGFFIGGALANRDCPVTVKKLHEEYYDAGADVSTTNNFVITEHTLRKYFGDAAQLQELTQAAASVAAEARDACAARCPGRKLLVAGSLPPLRESYEPLAGGELDDARRQYSVIAAALTDKCDILLCETLASVAEGRIAACAASATGLPVWVAWTLEARPSVYPSSNVPDSSAAKLRSGESLSAAVAAVQDVPGLAAALANCCAPFAISAAIPVLAAAVPEGVAVGGYGNGFRQTTSEWKASQKNGDSLSCDAERCYKGNRADEFDATGLMTPQSYAAHVESWVRTGASIVGGCCGIGPLHIQAISKIASPRCS